ncbi:MAG TPA: hypothetical protein VN626_03965 [Clostridia bacterium]|nr:hypothetical protein [Clostridia bacterium]
MDSLMALLEEIAKTIVLGFIVAIPFAILIMRNLERIFGYLFPDVKSNKVKPKWRWFW